MRPKNSGLITTKIKNELNIDIHSIDHSQNKIKELMN